jgi:exodeoxyribonuclease-5
MRDASSPEWSPQQVAALEKIRHWHDSRAQQTLYLAGYAGTGKTTLAKEIARQFGGGVVYGAFTGKAAAVMREKGCDGATTIDSLIYRQHRVDYCARKPPCGDDQKLCGAERCQFRCSRIVGKEVNPKSVVAEEAGLVIIDEVSMVNDQMGEDLESFEVPILVLGDPAQLPPIHGEGFFTRRDPDFLLTEVHRQALESPVLSMATRARTGILNGYGERGGSAIVRSIDPARMLDFDQIIAGRNVTRQQVNHQVRALLGFTDPMPVEGDRVVCLKNDHQLGIQNGTIWTVVSSEPAVDAGFVTMVVENETGHRAEVLSPVDGFLSTDGKTGELPENPFAYGYCITAHKAQGSQWRSVLIFDESWCWREDRWRWLYTAITRASERVTVVRPERRRGR